MRASVIGTMALRRWSASTGSAPGSAWKKPRTWYGPILMGEVLGHRAMAARRVAARALWRGPGRSRRGDHDLRDLEGSAVVEAFDGDAGQQVLVVSVEHVGQAIGVEHRLAGQDAVLAVGDEGHEAPVVGRFPDGSSSECEKPSRRRRGSRAIMVAGWGGSRVDDTDQKYRLR